MLVHPMIDQLKELRLPGMAKVLSEQLENAEVNSLSFEERLGFLIDREINNRDQRRLNARLSKAKLRWNGCMEDINYRPERCLDRALLAQLSTGAWIGGKRNVLITGATGTGKSWLACAIAHKACLLGHTVRYFRLCRLFEALQVWKGDGRYAKQMAVLAKTSVLVLDDWGQAVLNNDERHDLLEILEDRYERCSTLVTSQLPVVHWHDCIGDATLADAILDRLVHNAYKLTLKGESMRKVQAGADTDVSRSETKKIEGES